MRTPYLPFRPSAFCVALGLALVVQGRSAHAQEPTSTALFAEGQRLMSQGKYQDACPKFEKALALTAGAGTKFNLADCYERIGRLATAYTLFRDVESVTKQVGQVERSAVAQQRAVSLEPRVPMVIVRAPWMSSTPHAIISLDGRNLTAADIDKPIRVDNGEHVAVARSDGLESKARATVQKEGEVKLITLEAPGGAAAVVAPVPPVASVAPVAPVTEPPHEPPPAGGAQRVIGIVTAGAGLVAVAIGTVVVLGAKSDYDDATSACGTACPREQTTAANDARDSANVGGIVLGVGAAAAIAGGIIFLTAPSTSGKSSNATLRIAPGTARGFMGLSAVGTF